MKKTGVSLHEPTKRHGQSRCIFLRWPSDLHSICHSTQIVRHFFEVIYAVQVGRRKIVCICDVNVEKGDKLLACLNLRAVQLLLGHRKIESTVRYLGIEVDDALAIAEQVDV